MGGASQAAFSDGDFYFVIAAQVRENLVVAVDGGGETDDAGPLLGFAGTDDLIPLFFQAGNEDVGEEFKPLADWIDAGRLEEFEGGFEGEEAGDVIAAAFETTGVGAEGVVVVAVILGVDDVHPADHEGPGVLEEFAAAIEDAGAFGAQEPFVAVGGEIVDLHGFDVNWNYSQGLDAVDTEADFSLGAELSDAEEIMALAAGEFDVGKGNEAGARVGGGFQDFLERD